MHASAVQTFAKLDSRGYNSPWLRRIVSNHNQARR